MRLWVARAGDLPDRTARKFLFQRGEHTESGIVARHDGELVAYANRCQHRPLPLDWDDGEFYDRDREHFVCRTHGAVYEPATGLCVLGPCAGDALRRFEVSQDGDDVYVTLPDS